MKWFDALAGATERTWFLKDCTSDCIVDHMLTLGNGTKIYAPEDLIPAVAPDSVTARHARAASDLRDRADMWTWIGVGLAALTLATVTGSGHTNLGEDSTSKVILAIGGAAAIGPAIYGRILNHQSLEETDAAFNTYTKDLADRLEICVDNMRLVACDDRSPPSGPPGKDEPPLAPPAPQQHVPDGPVATGE